MFAGLKNLLQIAYSGIGLFSFGKMFGSMAWNLVKNIAKKFFKGVKFMYGLIFLNKISAKIINGAVQRARSVSADSAPSIFVKALFAVAIACIVAVGFMQASHSLDEDEDRIRRLASSRLRELEVTTQRLEQARQASLLRGWNQAVTSIVDNRPLGDFTNEQIEQANTRLEAAWQEDIQQVEEQTIPRAADLEVAALTSERAKMIKARQQTMYKLWEESQKQAQIESKQREEEETKNDESADTSSDHLDQPDVPEGSSDKQDKEKE